MPIFDQGYQHWKGDLGGYGWRWLAITRHGIRVGLKGFLLRMLLLAAVVPALALAAVMSIWGLVEQKTPWAIAFLSGIFRDLVNDPPAYRLTAWTLCFHFFLIVEMYYIMVLVILVGPSLISQDLRFNAFPLYFSRPVRRIDYFIGKLGVIAFFLGLITVAPAVLAWVLGLFFSLSFQAVFQTFSLLMGVVIFGVVVSLSAGLLILALSSLTPHSRYVGAMWGGVWVLTLTVSAMFEVMYQSSSLRNGAELAGQLNEKSRELNRLTNQPVPFDQRNAPRGFDGPGKRMDGPAQAAVQPIQDPKKVEDPKKSDEEQKILQEQEKKLRADRIAQLNREIESLQISYKEYDEERAEMMRDDWRPIISYTANLQRIGFALIDSYSAFEKVDELRGLKQKNMHNAGFDPSMRQPLATSLVPQYPWYWSALVLLALGGLSLWILHKRVTSLDRLK